MASKITYTNKEYLIHDNSIPNKNKVMDTDMNEIKSVVNNNADELDTATQNISGLTERVGTNENNIETLNGKVGTLETDNATNKRNITDLQNNKADRTELPTKVSDLDNDSGFINKDVNNLINYELKTNTGSSIMLSINSSTYVMTLQLKNSSGTVLSTGTVDLPLETMVVSATYDNTNKKIILTLKNGQTIDVPVGDLISGLQTEITNENKLASDLVDDTNQTNKFVTPSEKEQISDNATAINNIKNGQSINSFSDVETALGNKQNTLTFDNTPTENSTNPVTSGGVYSSQTAQDTLIAELQQENENLRNAGYKINGTGEVITLNKTSKNKFIKFGIAGNKKQKTVLIPNDYQSVEYIQSSGTQYLNTLIAPTDNFRVEAEFYSDTTSSFYVFGSRETAFTNIMFGQTGASDGSKVSFNVNGVSTVAKTEGVDWERSSNGQRYKVSASTNGDGTYDYKIIDITNNREFEAKNVQYGSLSGKTVPPMLIFAVSTGNKIGGNTKMYSMKFYDNNVKVFDGIPCYNKNNNTIGMYDSVSDTFLTNQGTGTFTKGSDTTLVTPSLEHECPIYAVGDNGTVNITIDNGEESTDPDYEHQPLAMPCQKPMVDTTDYFDWEREVEVHKWEKCILNGTESGWSKGNLATADRFVFSTSKYAVNTNSRCNYFKRASASSEDIGRWYNNSGTRLAFNFSEPNTTTLAQWKEWLSTHNLVLVQPLNTPEELPFTEAQKAVAKQIKKATSYYEQTNVYSTDNVSPIYDVTAVADMNLLIDPIDARLTLVES